MSPREHFRELHRVEPCACGGRIVAASTRDLDIERAVRLHNQTPAHARMLAVWERNVRESVRVKPAPPLDEYPPIRKAA